MEEKKDSKEDEANFADVVAVLTNMFGQIMDTNAITAIVESLEGDMNQSIEAIMHIVDDDQQPPSQAETPPDTLSPSTAVEPPIQTDQGDTNIPPKMSYTQAISTIPATQTSNNRPVQIVTKDQNQNDFYWTEQLQKIIEYHYRGYRTLIVMRGPPGCGKSYLANQILELTVGNVPGSKKVHIFSTDDFFLVNGRYVFDPQKLGDAHARNQFKAKVAIKEGLSPVIVDNTNIELWEMTPYVSEALKEGYYIELLEPNTPWASNAYSLSKKNKHNISISKIKSVLDKYQNNVTTDQLFRQFRLFYPAEKVPPLMRIKPAITHNNDKMVAVDHAFSSTNLQRNMNSLIEMPFGHTSHAPSTMFEEHVQENLFSTAENQSKRNVRANSTKMSVAQNIETTIYSGKAEQSSVAKKQKSSGQDFGVDEIASKTEILEIEFQKKCKEMERQLDEYDKLAEVWENGESWNKSPTNNGSTSANGAVPKPQRSKPTTPIEENKLIPNIGECNDWRSFKQFLPSWEDVPTARQLSPIPVEKQTTATSMEMGDFNNSNLKMVTGIPRDINFYYMPTNEKIPDKRTLDKSSMTNEQSLTDLYRCKNEEKHFSAFRKMFKDIARSDLRDIFDKCCGDVNWAVEIVLDGVATNQILQKDDVQSDSDEFAPDNEQCECTAAYNIIPNTANTYEMATDENNEPMQPQVLKKIKKGKSKSESSKKLKKQIEQNVVIADNHYSQHCLKIRKIRRGESDDNGAGVESSEATNEPSTSYQSTDLLKAIDRSFNNIGTATSEIVEETVNVNVGHSFIKVLDEMFDRKDTPYSSNIVPLINMPLSTLNQINALWIESLTHQLETQLEYSNILIKEDEEFARQLAEKSAELALQGKEPEVPDFKEIMDMDFALSLYQKDLKELKSQNERNDLAARMTRDKLNNLFPDVLPEVLSELLMAHDNNFKATVEVLLMSTGQAHILEQKNGINKFVVEKEMKRQERMLEEERKKVLSEVEWPLLGQGKIDMATVEELRQVAMDHLERRNYNYEQAHVYMHRGMTQVASYYSGMASFHKQMFEHANCRAATSLIQVNSQDRSNTTLDLHHLFVSEALQALDLFIDHHIQIMKDSNNRGRSNTLFLITGRGLHSKGGPKIKPAVHKRLNDRGFNVIELNPGLLSVGLSKQCKMTHELTTLS